MVRRGLAINERRRIGGVFLDTMSRLLRIPLAELGAESLKARNGRPYRARCAVLCRERVVSSFTGTAPSYRNILAGFTIGSHRLFGLAQRVGCNPRWCVRGSARTPRH